MEGAQKFISLLRSKKNFFFQNIKLRTLGTHECLTSCQNWKYNNQFFSEKTKGGLSSGKKLRNSVENFCKRIEITYPSFFSRYAYFFQHFLNTHPHFYSNLYFFHHVPNVHLYCFANVRISHRRCPYERNVLKIYSKLFKKHLQWRIIFGLLARHFTKIVHHRICF